MDPITNRTQECLTELETHFRDTKTSSDTIIIIGRTGAGKSSLLEDLTGLNGYSQESVNSVTQNVQIGKAVIENKEYFIMDTPGFDPGNEEKVYSEIIRGIQSIKAFSRIAGILYLTCINQPRFDHFDRKLIQFVYALCGDSYIPRVTFVTTFWTVSNKTQGDTYDRQLSFLRSTWEQEVHTQNLKTYQHGRGYYAGGQDTGWVIDWFEDRDQIAQHAREMIAHNYGYPTMYQDHAHAPDIVRELNANTSIDLTNAGRFLGLRSAHDHASNRNSGGNSERRNSAASGDSNPQTSHERESTTTPETTSNTQHRQEASQGPSWSQTALDVVSWFARNVNFEANLGGGGHGQPFIQPSMSRRYNGPLDSLSSVDTMKFYGLDSSKEGRLRYAASHGIGGQPFSAGWGDSIRHHVLRNHRQ